MRSLLFPLALLAALVVGAACGPDAEPELDGVRVRLLVDPIDAPLEGRFFIRAMQFGAPEHIPTFPLEPVPGDAGLYIARGAPAGVYGVRSESDWGMLWFAQNPPFLSDDPSQPPTQVQMGRGQTIYLRPTEYPREEGQGGVWRVEQVAPGNRVRIVTRDGAADPAAVEDDR